MPTVLCGLGCFDVPAPCTIGDVARDFVASLDPALEAAGCLVEVYRLERVLAPEVPVGQEDLVLCRLPAWSFDLTALEELHQELEELQVAHEGLKAQYASVTEALLAANASIEAREAEEAAYRSGAGTARGPRLTGSQEVELLRQQFEQNEMKEQERQASVKALRNQFTHLIDLWSDANSSGQNLRLEEPVQPPVPGLAAPLHSGSPQDTPRRLGHTVNGVNRVVQLLMTQACSWAHDPPTSRSPRRTPPEADQHSIGRGGETGRSTPSASQKAVAPARHVGMPPQRAPTMLCSPRAGLSSRGPRDRCTGRVATAASSSRPLRISGT